MTITVNPTTKTPTHHVSLEEVDNSSVKYGLILTQDGTAIRRHPRQNSNHVPFTQNDWTGGRGLKFATDDRTRYADAKRLNTRRAGQIALGGLETYTSGHRQVEQHMPADANGLTWQSLAEDQYIAYRLTASASGNRARVYLWIRKRGNPDPLTVRLLSDDAGAPDAELKTVQITSSDVEDTVSMLYEFTFETVQAVTSATDYWVSVHGDDDATTDNCWQVGVDADHTTGRTAASGDGTTWTGASYDLYFRLVDDTDIAGVRFFTYKSQLYMVTRPTTTSAPKLYMNGFRGVATGSQGGRGSLKDTTQSFPDLTGAILLIIDGVNSEWSQPYKTIVSSDSDDILTSFFGKVHVAGSTAYVILGTDIWTEITGHGLTVLPTDICDAGDVVYFAQGDTVKMRRMQETNIGGVWTRTFAEEDNYAKLLISHRDTRGLVITKANDYDNSNRPSVATARMEAWGTRLKFPWLIDACEVTTGWTAASNVTRSADGSLYKTGSASIKFAIGGAAAAGVFGYRAFGSPLNLFFQNKIRLWVYSTSRQDKAQFKLRLSEAADASSSNQDLDLPAIEANTWTQVELPIRHAAGLHNINSIGLVRIAGFTGALDFYVDGLETVPDGAETPLGNDTERITGLELYGDPEVVWVFRSGSMGWIANGVFNPVPLREFSQVESIHNGAGHLVHDVYLYVSFLQGLEQYYRANLDDIGPNKDEGLPADRQGYITSMIGYPDRFLTNIDAGAGFSSILSHKGGGWHEDFRGDTEGKRIRSLFLQVIPGDIADRLWFSEGEDIAYLPMPGNTVNELTDPTYLFTHEGVLEMGWIGDDQQRLYSYVKLGLENVSAARCIEWDYKLDDATAWTAMETTFTTGPVQTLALNKIGRRLKLRFRLQSNDNSETPRIISIYLSTTEQPEPRNSYAMEFITQDNGRDLQGQVENYSRTETLFTQLDTWAANKTPLLMRSVSSTIDGGSGRIVFLDPTPAYPIASVPHEQQEKMQGTITLTEPL